MVNREVRKEINKLFGFSAATLSAAFISFLSMFILTRMVPTVLYGKINLYNTASNLMMCFICMGLDSAYIRFYYEPPKGESVNRLIGRCIRPSLYPFVFISIILLIQRKSTFVDEMFGFHGTLFIVCLLLNVLALFILRYLTITFRMQGNIKAFSIMTIGTIVATRLLYVIVAIKYQDYAFIVNCSSIALLIFSFLFLIKEIGKVEFACGRHVLSHYKEVYKYALFESPLFVISYLNTFIPQLIVKNEMSDHLLGVLSGAMLFPTAIQALCSGLMTFWSPFVFSNYKSQQELIKKVHNWTIFCLTFGFILLLIFKDLLYFLIGKEFREHKEILGFLVLVPIFSILCETTMYGIGIYKKTYLNLIINGICFALNVFLCSLLVGEFGLVGVSIASMVATLFMYLLDTIIAQRMYSTIYSLGSSVCTLLIMIILPFWQWFTINDYIISFLGEFVLCICLVIVNINIVKSLLTFLREKLRSLKEKKWRYYD